MLKSGHGLSTIIVAASLAGAGPAAWAQAGGAGSIYTCVDAKGRKLTSDRPILECLDREQKELSASGTVKRTLKPSLTAEEAAREEEKQRRAAEEAARIGDEKKRERALLARYPNRATHDHERVQALQAVEAVITTALKRIADLEEERKKLATESEFYRQDPSKAPPSLKRRLDENAQTIAAQKRFIANQEQEKQRVNSRFDEELVKLNQIWAQMAKASAGTAPR